MSTPRKQKQKELRSQPALNGTERLKAVVRRLPPNLPEEIFWQSVQAWVTDETITWKSYHPGKLRTKRMNKEGIPSRAYIAFKTESQVAIFSRAYDGHVFRDKAGNESQAVVEYAPFQKVPTEKKKIDARNNTIDKDEDYLSFLETLKTGTKTESVSLETLIAASQAPPPPTTTPLLEALKAEKSAQKDKEAILRNHAHYKDASVSGSSKKEEAKKKAAAAAAAAATAPAHVAKPESPAPMGKKAKKAGAGALAPKASLQDGQGSGLGKSQPAGGAAPSSVKPPAPAPSAGHTPRQRPPKEPHGRSHPVKGPDTPSTPVPVHPSVSGLALPPTENATPSSHAVAPAPVQGQGRRKDRPTIGLGRHFEAALSGAGVAVSAGPGDRKRRDKSGEPGSAPGTDVAATSGSAPGPGTTAGTEGGGTSKAGKQKHREGRPHPSAVVPNILHRPAEVGTPDVMIIQRPQSPRGIESSEGHGEGGARADGPTGRGNTRRGRGRGRGGYRGG